MMSDGFNMGFNGGFMWLFWVLLVIAIVWALVMMFGSRKEPSVRNKTTLGKLEERYAKGEIDQQEFLQKRKDLGDL